MMDSAFTQLPLRHRAWMAAAFGAAVTYSFSWIVRFPARAVLAQPKAYVDGLAQTHGIWNPAVIYGYTIAGTLLISSASVAGGYAVAWCFRTPRSIRWALAPPIVYGLYGLAMHTVRSQTLMQSQSLHAPGHSLTATALGTGWVFALVYSLLPVLLAWLGWVWGNRRFTHAQTIHA
jgi:hypothetical protein